MASVALPPVKDRSELPALTSLRFFAAFYVVLFHGAKSYVSHSIAKSFVNTGFIAVDFFFILSGFVLAYRYTNDNGACNTSNRQFWTARFARIYPVYIASMVVGAPFYLDSLRAVTPSMHMLVVKAILSGVPCIVLLQSWFYRIAASWNGPAWSLSVEAFLYAAFPFTLPKLTRLVQRRDLIVCVLGLWVLAMAAPTTYMVLRLDGHDHIGPHTGGTWLNTLRFTPIFHLPSFLIGVATGWSFLARPRRLPTPVVAGATVLLAIALCGGAWLPYPHLHAGLLAPLFAVVIDAAAGLRGVPLKILGWRPLVELGDASYALYLLHYPLLVYTEWWVGGTLSLGQFVLFFIALQLLCVATFRFYETPTRRWLRRKLRRQGAPDPRALVPS